MSTVADNVCLRQDRLLTQLKQAKVPVSLYLLSGVKLQGYIESFDSHVVVLRDVTKAQMIFKHAILTIVPSIASI